MLLGVAVSVTLWVMILLLLFCFSFGLLTDMGFLRPLLHSWPIFSRQSRSIWVHCIFVYPFCLHYLQTHATNIVCRAREVNNT